MPAEVAGEQEDDSAETGDGEADDEEAGDEDDEVGQEVGEVDSSSEGDGRQSQSASMSSRSESKPYSSVTHKCEVRNISLGEGGKNKETKYIYKSVISFL